MSSYHAADVVQRGEAAGECAIDRIRDAAATTVAGCTARTQAETGAVVVKSGKVAARQNGACDAGAAGDPGDIVVVQFGVRRPQDQRRGVGIGGGGAWVGTRSATIHMATDSPFNHDLTVTCRKRWQAQAGTEYAADQEQVQ